MDDIFRYEVDRALEGLRKRMEAEVRIHDTLEPPPLHFGPYTGMVIMVDNFGNPNVYSGVLLENPEGYFMSVDTREEGLSVVNLRFQNKKPAGL